MIEGCRDFFSFREVAFVTKDQKERPDALAFAQREFTDAVVEDGVDQMEPVVFLDVRQERSEALVDLFTQ